MFKRKYDDSEAQNQKLKLELDELRKGNTGSDA